MAAIALGGNFNSIKINKPHANMDYWYGPYTSKEEALVKIPREVRGLGLTIGIYQFVKNLEGTYIYSLFEDEATGLMYYAYVEDTSNSNLDKYSLLEIEEYQWKRSIEDSGLDKKGESSLILELISPSKMEILENTPIKIKLTGGVTPNSVLVYEIRNDLEFLTDYVYLGAIPLNSEIGLNLDILGNPRTMTYRIRVIDKNGLYAKTIDEQNYVEVTIDYKEIALYNINTNNIDSLTVKNANNLLEKTFTFSVGYINSVINYNVSLNIGDNAPITSINNVEGLGNDAWKITLPSNLSADGGKDIIIKIAYTKEVNGTTTTGEIQYNVVTIMAKGVFSNIKTELSGGIFYTGNKIPCRIYFEAESLETYSIVSTNDSDFSFNGRIMAYAWNTIYITPTAPTGNRYAVFKFVIDGRKDVIASSEGKIIDFTKSIFTGTYTPSDPTTLEFKDSHTTQVKSFILDLYCFINWTQIKETVFLLGNITIDKDLILFGNIAYPTPLLRNVHIGFEYLVTNDSSIDSGNKVVYNAIYIDGVLCKNLKVDEEESGKLINNFDKTDNFIILNDSQNNKCIYLYTSVNSNIYPFTTRTFTGSNKYVPILLNNFEYYTSKEDMEQNLPTLELTAFSLNDGRYDLRNQALILSGKNAIIASRFGTLEEGQTKYNTNIDASSGLYNVLLKQRTSLKKALLKSRGVLCSYRYIFEGEVVDSGIVEVHTQGTSTLDYRLPNFKFTFLNSDNLGKKKKVNFVQGYQESVLTAKTDYMDSSHLNNTPTATYYNKVIHSGFFEADGEDYRSPSAKEGGLDAITGIPIIMSIKDVDSDEFVNYGSFMLNIDKTGDALKFKVEETVDECISFEGTSNAFDSGLSSRFIIPNELVTDFNRVNENISNPSLFYSSENNGSYRIDKSGITTVQLSVVNVLNYFAEGLEYRYPDGDLIKESKDKTYYTIMPIEQFRRLFEMFYWVANSGNLTEQQYKELFVLLFNYDYCALYFIFLMVFAQTDNLGKNCMFDQWYDPHGSHSDEDCRWYPRPYDLDSLIGLDNNGFDGIAPFVEIAPQFSLEYNLALDKWNNFTSQLKTDYLLEYITNHYDNWDSIRKGEWDALSSDLDKYLESTHLLPNSKLDYPESTTPDLMGKAKRYSFSSSSSNLWFNFYKNFKEEIKRTYRELRNYKVNSNLVYDSEEDNTLLSAETIINFYKQLVLDKLGDAQYNLDFLLKYLGDIERQYFGLGNRWDKFLSWLNKRIQYCDVYFYYKEFKVQLSTFNREILLNSPLYVITRYDQVGSAETVYFFDGEGSINVLISGEGTASSGLKYVFYLNPEAILEGNIYTSLQSSNPKMRFDSIVNLNIEGRILNDIVDISNASYLSNLTIRKLNSAYSSDLPVNVKNIVIEDSSALPIEIKNLPYLESITIRNCNVTGGKLTLTNLGTEEKPINLIIENSKILLELSYVNVGNFVSNGNTIESLVVTNTVIPSLQLKNQNIGTIGFSGDESRIDILDLRGSTFTNPSLNLSIIATNVKHLLLNDTRGLITIVSSNRFINLKYFGLMNSEVENFIYDKSGEDSTVDHFDGKLLPDILPTTLYCQRYTEGGLLSSESFINSIDYKTISVDLNEEEIWNYYSGTSLATRSFNLELTNIVKVINLNILDSNISDDVPLNSVPFTLGNNVTGVIKLFTNCSKLLSVNNSYIKCSGEKMFKGCHSLQYINSTRIKVGTSAYYMFSTCSKNNDNNANGTLNSINYSYIDAFLTDNPLILDFRGFLYNTSFISNTTIDLGKYASGIQMDYAFCLATHSERGMIPSKGNGITLTFTGVMPANVTSMYRTFEMASNSGGTNNFAIFTNWNNLVNGCSKLTSMHTAFYYCRKNNNLIDNYYEITTDWFPGGASELNLEGCFAYSRVKLVDLENNPFRFKSNIINCLGTFCECLSLPNNEEYDVKSIFANCSKLETAILCFYNNRWAKTTGPLELNSNLTRPVNVRGMFSTSSIDSFPTVWGQISGNYTCSESTTYASGRTYTYHFPLSSSVYDENYKNGTFYNRKVSLGTDNYQFIGTDLSNFFRSARITLTEGSILSVTLNSANINRMFYRTSIVNSVGATYSTLSPTLIDVLNAYMAFAIVSRASGTYYRFPVDLEDPNKILPIKLPSSLIDARYMFYGQHITEIPIDYFKYTVSENNGVEVKAFLPNILYTDYMFAATKISELPSDGEYGLLPNTIRTASYMFYYCYNLRGGIPNNLFNVNTRLTSLRGMFNSTGVLYNLDPATNLEGSIFSALDLKTLTPNVTDVTQLFYFNYVASDSAKTQRIKYDCFKNCTIFNSTFMYSSPIFSISKDGKTGFLKGENTYTWEMRIDAPVNMSRMFVGLTGRKITFELLEELSIASLKDISAMVHGITTTSINSSNTSDDIVYELLNKLKNYYTTYQIMMLRVTLDNCLGKWTKDTSQLGGLEIPSSNNYQVAQYWYNAAVGITTGLGYVSESYNPAGV